MSAMNLNASMQINEEPKFLANKNKNKTTTTKTTPPKGDGSPIALQSLTNYAVEIYRDLEWSHENAGFTCELCNLRCNVQLHPEVWEDSYFCKKMNVCFYCTVYSPVMFAVEKQKWWCETLYNITDKAFVRAVTRPLKGDIEAMSKLVSKLRDGDFKTAISQLWARKVDPVQEVKRTINFSDEHFKYMIECFKRDNTVELVLKRNKAHVTINLPAYTNGDISMQPFTTSFVTHYKRIADTIRDLSRMWAYEQPAIAQEGFLVHLLKNAQIDVIPKSANFSRDYSQAEHDTYLNNKFYSLADTKPIDKEELPRAIMNGASVLRVSEIYSALSHEAKIEYEDTYNDFVKANSFVSHSIYDDSGSSSSDYDSAQEGKLEQMVFDFKPVVKAEEVEITPDETDVDKPSWFDNFVSGVSEIFSDITGIVRDKIAQALSKCWTSVRSAFVSLVGGATKILADGIYSGLESLFGGAGSLYLALFATTFLSTYLCLKLDTIMPLLLGIFGMIGAFAFGDEIRQFCNLIRNKLSLYFESFSKQASTGQALGAWIMVACVGKILSYGMNFKISTGAIIAIVASIATTKKLLDDFDISSLAHWLPQCAQEWFSKWIVPKTKEQLVREAIFELYEEVRERNIGTGMSYYDYVLRYRKIVALMGSTNIGRGEIHLFNMWNQLTNVYTSVVRIYGITAEKQAPMWIALYGEAGTGKSTLVQRLVAELAESGNLPGAVRLENRSWDFQSACYKRDNASKFWTGYNGQASIWVDDIGSNSDDQFIKFSTYLFSAGLTYLNQASMDDTVSGKKGDISLAKYVITTSNTISQNNATSILLSDQKAYKRRRQLLVRVKLNPEYSTSGILDTAKLNSLSEEERTREWPHLRFDIMHSLDENIVRADITLKQLWTEIVCRSQTYFGNAAWLGKSVLPFYSLDNITFTPSNNEFERNAGGQLLGKPILHKGNEEWIKFLRDEGLSSKNLTLSQWHQVYKDYIYFGTANFFKYKAKDIASYFSNPFRGHTVIKDALGETLSVPNEDNTHCKCEIPETCTHCISCEECSTPQLVRAAKRNFVCNANGACCPKACVVNCIHMSQVTHFSEKWVGYYKKHVSKCSHCRVCPLCINNRNATPASFLGVSLSVIVSTLIPIVGVFSAAKLFDLFNNNEVSIDEFIAQKKGKGKNKKSHNSNKAGSSPGADKDEEEKNKRMDDKVFNIVYGGDFEKHGGKPKDHAKAMIFHITITDNNGKVVWGNGFTPKGRYGVFPAHYFDGLQYPLKCDVKKPQQNGFEFIIRDPAEWTQGSVVVDDNGKSKTVMLDLAVVRFPHNQSLGRNKTNLFQKDLCGRSLSNLCLLTWTPKDGYNTHSSKDAVFMDRYVPNLLTEDCYKTPGIHFKGDTEDGDCGGILIDLNNENCPILGFLQGRYKSGWCRCQYTPPSFWENLPDDVPNRESFEEFSQRKNQFDFEQQGFKQSAFDQEVDFKNINSEYYENDKTAPQTLQPFAESVCSTFVPPDNIKIEGCVTKHFKYNLAEETRLVKSIFYDDKDQYAWGKPKKEPAVLYAGDPRGNGTSPLKNAMSDVSVPVSPSEGQMDEAGDWLINDYVSAAKRVRPNLFKLTEQQIVRGVDGSQNPDPLPRKSSPGWPNTKFRPPGVKGREHILDIDKIKDPAMREQIKMREELAKAETMPYDSIFAWVGKDEKLKIEKVENNMTRFFMVAPFDHLYLSKKYFGAFVQWFEEAKEWLFHAIGINPFSRDWDNLIQRMRRVGTKGFDGDYKRFDKSILSQLQWQGVRAINYLYRLYDPTWTEEDDKIRRTLIMEAITTKSLAIDTIFTMRSGVPSGFYLTALMNSCINRMLVIMAYRKLFPDATYQDFRREIDMACLGDDIILAINDAIVNDFTGTYYQQFLKDLGITYTSADKTSDIIETKDITELEFLKCRTKVLSGGNVVAVPEKICADSMLSYVRTEGPPEQQKEDMVSCANDALRFVFWHGKEEFERYRNDMIKITRQNDVPSDFLTYKQVLDWYKEGFGNDFDLGDYSQHPNRVVFHS